MKVYMVYKSWYFEESYEPVSIHRTREGAEAYIASKPVDKHYKLNIDEWEVGE